MNHLEPETFFSGCFDLGDSKALLGKWLFHQTSFQDWLFRVTSMGGMGISLRLLRDNDRFMGIEGANFPGNSRPNQGVSGTMMGFITPFK